MTNGLEKAKMAITEVCEALKTSDAIPRAIDDLCAFLISKNEKYDNSVFEPLRLFSRASIEDLIRVRLDDKVTRILRGQLAGEDSFDDFAGYLVLLRALPLYLRSITRRFQDDDMSIAALTYNRLCDVAGLEVAERVFLATPEGGDVVEDMQGAIEQAQRANTEGDPANWKTWPKEQREQIQHMFGNGTVPGSVVTASLANRGLRVGMTYAEVRDNQWTQCAWMRSDGFDTITPCGKNEDPCSACKFLDGAMCKCGHSYMLHSESENCVGCDDGCGAFSLTSWATESLDDVAAEVAAHVNANVDGWTAVPPQAALDAAARINKNCEHASAVAISDGSEYGAVVVTECAVGSVPNSTHCSSDGVRTQSEERNRDLAAEAARVSKPRINRATWHETNEGKAAIQGVLFVLKMEPIQSRYARDLPALCGHALSDVTLALRHLLATNEAVYHGRAKGTRYAVAGFTDWPAPRQKKTDVADFVNVIGEENQ